MKTQSCLVAAFVALAACDAKNDQGAINGTPITTGNANDAAESAAGQNAGGGAVGAEANDCCSSDGSPAGKDAESPKDAAYEPEVDAGCSCSQEPGGNVYRISLACFCRGSCYEYHPAQPAQDYCDPPNSLFPPHHARLTTYSACSLIGVEITTETDSTPMTLFFDANTNKQVGARWGPPFFGNYGPYACQDAGMNYTVVAGAQPTCAGTFVRDLCAKQDASAGGD